MDYVENHSHYIMNVTIIYNFRFIFYVYQISNSNNKDKNYESYYIDESDIYVISHLIA